MSAAVVREIYERFRSGDERGGLELIDADAEVHDRPEIPDPKVYRGHEGVLSALGESRSEFDDVDLVPEEFIEVGDKVVVQLHFVGRGRESGFPIDEVLCHVWTLRGGKAVRMDVHGDRDEALRSAGA
jgi:ketosteroid isomerase-like protein